MEDDDGGHGGTAISAMVYRDRDQLLGSDPAEQRAGPSPWFFAQGSHAIFCSEWAMFKDDNLAELLSRLKDTTYDVLE